MDSIELLRKYKELMDEGIITQDEFEKKRNQILSQPEVEYDNGKQQNSTLHELNRINGGEENASIGWGVLGAFIPIVGLILFLVWRQDKPKSAKYSGIGALIGVGISLLFYVISIAYTASSMY